MKIKVCGITRIEQMRQMAVMGVDYVGMIFYPPSKRYAGDALAGDREELRALPIQKVGVFVNTEVDDILRAIERFSLSAVQLHGDESSAQCRRLMAETEVIKAIRVSEQMDLEAVSRSYEAASHFLLFDTDAQTYGGSGKKFNWALLQSLPLTKPFFLSGGIGPEDADELSVFPQPLLQVVDVNSRFEVAPGIKDMKAVSGFVQKLKNI